MGGFLFYQSRCWGGSRTRVFLSPYSQAAADRGGGESERRGRNPKSRVPGGSEDQIGGRKGGKAAGGGGGVRERSSMGRGTFKKPKVRRDEQKEEQSKREDTSKKSSRETVTRTKFGEGKETEDK